MARVALAVLAVLAATLARAADRPPFWSLPPEELRVLVASGQVLATRTATGFSDYYCRCPVVLRPHEIPDVVKRAVIAVEDRNFNDHGGVDWFALHRIVTSGFRHGASTIPMQLAKNLLFHDLRASSTEAKAQRKYLEIQAAHALSAALGKDEMLAAYLNQVEFGGREIVGLYRAARHYFRKEPRDLTVFEAAVLVGMLKAPSRLDPLDPAKREAAFERARFVLGRMVEQKVLSEAERRRAEAEGVRPGAMPPFRIQAQAFAEWVVQGAARDLAAPGETIRFFVTIEPRWQRIAELALAELADKGALPEAYEAAALVASPDGRVRAMIGSRDWARNQFNQAVKASVQAGSTAKLPLLVAACEKGRGPGSRVLDEPLGAWPDNGAVGYRGPTTLAEAIASSRNAAAVRLARDLGPATVAATSRRLGLDPGPKPDAGLVLGPFSTNLLAVTGAYAAVANRGLRAAPTGVLAVVDGRGAVRDSFLARGAERVMPARCVEPVHAVLHEVVRSGTGTAAAPGRWKAYGKTGTSTGNADAWFVGWSEGRVVGVWMGRPRGAEGPALAGKDAPAQLFRRVVQGINHMEEYRGATARAGRPPVPLPPRRPATPVAKKAPDKTAPATSVHARSPPRPAVRPRTREAVRAPGS